MIIGTSRRYVSVICRRTKISDLILEFYLDKRA
jgi:hypothetical protein